MIVVTGGAGFIGSNIIKALNKKGINDILVVDNLRNGTKIVNLTDLNISDYIDKKEYLKQIMSKKVFNHIDAIFHEGACSSTTEWNGKYIMYNNYQYSKELLHFCIENTIPFLYASSGAVYGNYIKSDKHYKALNIYGYSKSLFDEYVYRLLPKAKSQIVGFRYFNVYGPNEQHKQHMASIIFHIYNQIKKNDNLKLFQGSKNFKRDFIHIDDVVSVNLWFLENGVSGIFDIGTGYAESFQTIAKIILNYYHKNNNIVYIPFPENLKSYYQIFTQADLTNLRNVGYNKPFKHVNEGIKEYLFWLN